MINDLTVSIIFGFVVATLPYVSAQQVEKNEPCTKPNGENGTYILLNECPFLYKLACQASTKLSLSDTDKEVLQQKSQCGPVNNQVLVCCSAREKSAKTAQHIDLIPEPGLCGNSFQRRIYGGKEANLDEHPWMALIEYNQFENSEGHHCEGSLITNRYVLTAAHCIHGIPEFWKPVRVRLGEWDTKTNPDCLTDISGNKYCADEYVEVEIEQIVVHPSYEMGSINQMSDIALLRLSNNITYTDFIQPICLPLKDVLRNSTFEGVVMDAVGWGKTEQGFLRSDKKLRAAVPVISLEECQRIYQSARLGKGKRTVDNQQICAGGEIGVGTCRGDSGGPLVGLDSSNKSQVYSFIAGIISYGPLKCGLPNWPSVYTKVAEFTDWIIENIEP